MRQLRDGAESTEPSYTNGVYTVLKVAVIRSETVSWPWHLADGQQATKPVFCSEDR